MTDFDDDRHRSILKRIARRAMIERGLLPDFSPQAIAEVERIVESSPAAEAPSRDFRNLLWCSIDNDDSRDLDQLTAAEALSGGSVKILVAIVDVSAVVKKGSAIDSHARQNTTSVYTEAKVYSMLPEKLSTDLTSLAYGEERSAVVIEMVISGDGSMQSSDIYLAKVRNRAKLAYSSVAAWLEGSGAIPKGISDVPGLAENLRLQDGVARQLKKFRHLHGALTLETIEARIVFDDGVLKSIEAEKKNRARDIIEDFMIAANGVTARYLSARNLPSLRRVVRSPKRWNRIVDLASDEGFALPAEPDSRALEDFLTKSRDADPVRFPDLSLSVIKLLGAGEYLVEAPAGQSGGHFGLAVKDYTHSTAPNRRYPDIITQRMLKAAIAGEASPYRMDELEELASHCTEKEDAARKVERQVRKSAAALLLEPRIGEQFDGVITGAAEKGTWVRIFNPPIEGRLTSGFEKMDVGHRLRVQLVSADVQRGFIDFRKVG